MAPTSVLSDGTIERLVRAGRIVVEPWDASMVQPASVDLRLGPSFRVFHNHRVAAIDLDDPPGNLTERVVIDDDEPFVIHPGEFVLGRTLEYVELPDDIVARIEGKALALDTEVPTPHGMRDMSDLEIGDEVFDADGRPVPVVATSEVMIDRECREVVFSDGTTVVADIDHQWEASTRYDRSRRGQPRIATTAEIERTLMCGREYNWHVAQAPAVQHPERDLPIDPYVLGGWLGDGTSTTADLTTVDALLARGPREIVASLGHRPVVATKPARLYGKDRGPRHEVTFTPDRPVFRLRRKLARQKTEGRFKRGRSIVAVKPVPSVPVRCIQVGDPRGVFLITRSFIPTHNSSLGRLGLIVHATAGFVDPGFRGTLTLEITNLTRVPIKLYAGRPIAQLSFMTLDAPARRPYGSPELGSHYQGQVDATESRYGATPAGNTEGHER